MKKILIPFVIFLATFIMMPNVDAYFKSIRVQVEMDGGKNEFKKGEDFNINMLVPHMWYGQLDGKVDTRIRWYTVKNGKQYEQGWVLYYHPLMGTYLPIEMSQMGDYHKEKKPFKADAGGKYEFHVYAVPVNYDTGQIDERIPSSTWPGNSVTFYIYEDNNASSSFASNKITKNVKDGKFTNPFNTNSDGKVKYSSSNEKVAKVSDSGEVTIKGEGKVTITAKVERTYIYKASTASYTLNVVGKEEVKEETTATTTETTTPTTETTTTAKQEPTTKKETKKTTTTTKKVVTALSAKFQYGDATLTVGQKLTNTLIPSESGGTISYKSTNTSVCTVNSSGTVTPIKVGSCRIAGTFSKNGNSVTVYYNITVKAKTTTTTTTTTQKTITRATAFKVQ